MGGPLGDMLHARDNALNAIRLALAVAVIVGHSWPLTGTPGEPQLAHWAVAGFFAISGYLIARSRSHLTIWPFLKRRLLRILPAFWAALLLVAFVAAPASTLLTEGRYDLGSAVDYVTGNAFLLQTQWGIEHTIAGNPYRVAWNGSLWTLYYEFLAYLMAAAVVVTPLCRRWPLPTTLALHGLFVAWYTATVVPAAWLGAFFTAGMVIWAAGDRARASWALVVTAGGVVAAVTAAGWFEAAAPLPLAYGLLGLGALARTRIATRNDLSYGTYVLAFPTMQLLAAAGIHELGVLPFCLISIAVTLPLAAASWFLLERPALRLAHRPLRVRPLAPTA